MPNNTTYCRPVDEVKMADLSLPLSFTNPKVEEKLCKLNYSSWCPTCDRESPRRRTRSETNDTCRRRQREMKTLTPKKYQKNTEYENMELEYDPKDVKDFRYDCCRVRSNLCELPTTYITNNCQMSGNYSNLQRLSNVMSDFTEFVEKNTKSDENSTKFLDVNGQFQNYTMPDNKSKYSTKLEDYNKIYSENSKVKPIQLDSFKSQYNVIRRPGSEQTKLPSKMVYQYDRNFSKTHSVNIVQLNSSVIPNNGKIQSDAKHILPKKHTVYEALKTAGNYDVPTIFGNRPQSHFNVVDVKFPGEKEENSLSYETGTFFDKRYNIDIRERYRREIEALRVRLNEMKKNTTKMNSLKNNFITDRSNERSLPPNVVPNTLRNSFNADTNEIQKSLNSEFKSVNTSPKIESSFDSKPTNFERKLQLPLKSIVANYSNVTVAPKSTGGGDCEVSVPPMGGCIPKTPRPSLGAPKTVEVLLHSANGILKKNGDLTPLDLKKEAKNDALKTGVKLKSKLSSVKLKKLRSMAVNGTKSNSNSTESDLSDSEKSESEEVIVESESLAEERKVQSPSVKEKKYTTVNPNLPPPDWHIRDSLFPHIPPYLVFNYHDSELAFNLPIEGKKHFKWKLSTITPIVVRKTLYNSGFRLVRSEFTRESNEWIGTWGKHMKSPMFQTLREGQKLNHFPGTFQIGRKDRLWKNLQRLIHKFGQKEFGFIPHTYILPQELKLLKQNWEQKNGSGGEKWIIKPPASARGVGIKVIHKWSQLPKKVSLIVQEYISRPYLINGSKFDLRLYVLVTSFDPLRIYLWPDGLARFASARYSEDSRDLKDRYIHLTNYSINKMSSQYTSNDDANSCQGHKWTLSKLWEYMEKEGVDTKSLWTNLQDLVIKTIISGEASISSLCKENMNTRYNCYELFGIDVLLDYKLKPWLLEVNISPSLHSASPLDSHVKGPLVKHLFDLAQFHIPQKIEKYDNKCPPVLDNRLYTTALLKKERNKHNNFLQVDTRVEYLDDILEHLTGDDVRHLTQAEDEYVVKGKFERIFPTSRTYSYLHFMEPRYYNRLFDAWENKYENNRKAGIAVLRKLCSEKIHLKVAQHTAINRNLLNMNLGDSKLQPSREIPAMQMTSSLLPQSALLNKENGKVEGNDGKCLQASENLCHRVLNNCSQQVC